MDLLFSFGSILVVAFIGGSTSGYLLMEARKQRRRAQKAEGEVATLTALLQQHQIMLNEAKARRSPDGWNEAMKREEDRQRDALAGQAGSMNLRVLAAEKRAEAAEKALEDLRNRKGLAARQQEALIESLKSQNKQMSRDLCEARGEANRLKANMTAAVQRARTEGFTDGRNAALGYGRRG